MGQKPCKILYIHQDGGITGSAISLRNLLTCIDRSRYQPRVLLGRDGPARAFFESAQVPVDVVPIHPYWIAPGAQWFELSYYYNWRAFLPNKLLDLYLRQQQPDIVHINDKAMLSAGLHAARLKLPVVWHLRSSYYSSYSRMQADISRLVIRKIAKRLIAISEDEVDGFEEAGNLTIIHNSVDLQAAGQAFMQRDMTRQDLGLGEDDIAIGFIGQLNEKKGAWDFIRAAGLANQKCPGAHLHFYLVAPIPGRERRRLGLWERLGIRDTTHPEDVALRLASEVRVAGQLTLTGYRDDILPFLSAIDLLVSCNHLGAMGRQPLEAVAVGTPVIAYAGHSGKSTVIVHGETGMVVPKGNIEALSHAMVELAAGPEQRKKMGQAGYEYARAHFNPHINAQAVLQLYDDLRLENSNHAGRLS